MADAQPLAEERWYHDLIDKGVPGAWSYEIYVEGEGSIVARSYLNGEGPECAEGNRRIAERVRLMTAAPDLLAACEMLVTWPDAAVDGGAAFDAAVDAIAKARGEEPAP